MDTNIYVHPSLCYLSNEWHNGKGLVYKSKITRGSKFESYEQKKYTLVATEVHPQRHQATRKAGGRPGRLGLVG